MIASPNDWTNIFEAIKSDIYASEEKGVPVFVSTLEADSVCAAQQLVHILQRSSTPYNLFPVNNYADISRLFRDHVGTSTDLCTVILINCGGTQDIRNTCPEFNANVRAIVVDSHRPIWHGYNVDSDHSVVVVVDEDDPVPKVDIPAFVELDLELMDIEDEPEPSDSEGDDAEDEDDAEEGRQDVDAASDGERQSGGGSAASDSRRRRPLAAEGGEPPRKRRRRERQEEQQRRDAEKQARRAVVHDYYEGKSGYGKPCTLLLYQLVHSLHAESAFQIWLAALGLTEQLLHQRVDPLAYERWRAHLEGHLSTLGPAPGATEHAVEGLTNQVARHNAVVVPCSDLKLTLHKHWTLFESMRYTNYVASRLQTWRERGLGNLRGVLAKMGVMLREADRDWKGMRPDSHQQLRNKLATYGPQYNLNIDQLQFNSFEFQYEHEMRLAASDMTFAITAMLCRPNEPGRDPNANFNAAGDLLHVRSNVKILQDAIHRAKSLAVAIVQDGGLAITRQLVRGTRVSQFGWYNLSVVEGGRSEVFVHPCALLRLAIFLRDAQTQRLGKAKPFILVGSPDAQGNSYIVSLRGKQQAGIMQHNPFGKAFKSVLEATGIQNEAPSFDSCLYYMKSTSTELFLEELRVLVEQAAHAADSAQR